MRLLWIAAASVLAVATAVYALRGESGTREKAQDLSWLHATEGLPEQIASARAAGLPVAFENSLGMRFVWIPAGKFSMGSPSDEPMRNQDEDPHDVELTRPFYVSIYETRNRDYGAFRAIETHRPRFDGPDQPVVNVSFEDATAFAKWLGERDPAHRYSLPTEAQWEYAARAGTVGPYPFARISRNANFYAPPEYTGDPESFVRGRTTDVGSFPANAWGLHDTVGNVEEWCSDWYGERYGDALRIDPSGSPEGKERALRGGYWGIAPWNARSASRTHFAPSTRGDFAGFRLVAEPVRP